MMFRRIALLTLAPPLAALCFAACPSSGGTPKTEPPVTAGGSQLQPKTASAKLVVGIVLDQLPTSAILRYAPHLPKDGVLRRAIEEGLFQERVRYGYAGTNTAPGHASIYTGELPADHGIDRNDVYSRKAARKQQIVDDGKHAVFKVEGSYASPFELKKPTVGDALRSRSPESRVVSISLKARAAVVSAGQKPDFVAWYDYRIPGFTTSEFYADELPAWMVTWNQANPMKERLTTWSAENPKLYQEVIGDDAALGESDWYGLGTTFPHELAGTRNPNKTFIAAPQSMQYLIDMTRAVVEQYAMGADAHPDLLLLSVSTTDYAGHAFGTSSWEYLDVLIKTDRALGALVRDLEATTDVAVLITSDHGGTPLAEHSLAAGKPGGRLVGAKMVEDLEAAANKALGAGKWFQLYAQPYLYLTDEALKSEKRAELMKIVEAYVETTPELRGIYPAETARTHRRSDDWLARDIANTIPDSCQELFVVPAEGHVAISTKDGFGTGHGTPWDADREVPVLAFGAGVSKSHDSAVTKQNRVAPTIAALLGLDWHLPAKALEGAPRPNGAR
ncbi:MAG: hypothetical protein GY811_24415 [Myxococcales bacterium]|nr:hypothetical protein [Myxococcales bacterium]